LRLVFSLSSYWYMHTGSFNLLINLMALTFSLLQPNHPSLLRTLWPCHPPTISLVLIHWDSKPISRPFVLRSLYSLSEVEIPSSPTVAISYSVASKHSGNSNSYARITWQLCYLTARIVCELLYINQLCN
jgi:hypothetical protein